MIGALVLLGGFCAFALFQDFETETKWNREPETIRVAAAKNEHQMMTMLQMGDLIRTDNGRICAVDEYHIGAASALVRFCAHCVAEFMPIRGLAREGGRIITRNTTEYSKTLSQFPVAR
jgi:hypothetical protein